MRGLWSTWRDGTGARAHEVSTTIRTDGASVAASGLIDLVDRRRSCVATVEDVRWLGSSPERSYQVYVRGSLRFRVLQRGAAALVATQPHRFHLPRPSELARDVIRCAPR